MSSSKKPNRKGKTRIFRPWITKKDGTKVYAKDYGLKAFPIGKSL